MRDVMRRNGKPKDGSEELNNGHRTVETHQPRDPADGNAHGNKQGVKGEDGRNEVEYTKIAEKRKLRI